MCTSSTSPKTPSVLVIEDEAEIAELLATHIRTAGYTVQVIDRGLKGLMQAQQDRPDLILLDLMLPDVNGLEVCRELARSDATRHIPVMIVTARGEEEDIVSGLESGASDYITKPFSSKVLIARIRNLFRRIDVTALSNGSNTVVKFANITIDNHRHEVNVDGKVTDLTLSEYEILLYLAKRPGFVRTRDQIISALHGDRVVMSRRTIDVHVTALRRKLGEAGSHIETVRGVGYRLTV